MISCIEEPRATKSSSGSSTSNSKASVDDGNGRVLEDNPIVVSGNDELEYDANLTNYLSSQVEITDKTQLIGDCENSSEQCFYVTKDENQGDNLPFDNGDNRWAFETNTDEFLQVNAFYHIKSIIEQFNSDLKKYVVSFGVTNDSIEWTNDPLFSRSALPDGLYSKNLLWKKQSTSLNPTAPKVLKTYADCDAAGSNAYYNSANFEICMGKDSVYGDYLKYSQDSTVLYHEMGHGLVDMMYNIRNNAALHLINEIPYTIRADYYDTSTCSFNSLCNTGSSCNIATDNPTTVYADQAGAILKTSTGQCFYSLGTGYFSWVSFTAGSDYTNSFGNIRNYEALSINEGIADYFSYYMNERTSVFEWAFGRYLDGARPLSEEDSLHKVSVSTTGYNNRLSYPQYITYNSSSPTNSQGDIHYTGQIFSHFLVSLSDMIVDNCYIKKRSATRAVVNILTESLAELGDLTAKGTDELRNTNKYAINMNPDLAFQWSSSVRPPNFRNFTQSFARHAKNILVNSTKYCSGSLFTKNDLEILLDGYGLLLFRTYNDDLNSSALPLRVNEEVTITNRIRSELITKNQLEIESRSNYSEISIFDDRQTMNQLITNYINEGEVLVRNVKTPDARYNNGNGKVSPGEIFGLYVNLYNDSNQTMGGARVIASPWAHAEGDLPCANYSDNFPSVSEGGVNCTTLSDSNFDDDDRYHPACLLEYKDSSSTQILTQREFYNKLVDESGFLAKDCLDENDVKNCFIRAIPGADSAEYSLIKPKSNWLESDKKPKTNEPNFKDTNIILFEANKNIPQGTRVVCRLRANFSNCDDCYHSQDASRDNDDYYDWEFAGEDPFKVLNIDFTVIE